MPVASPSLTQLVFPLETGAHVTAAFWLKDTAAFGLGDGNVLLVTGNEKKSVATHEGGCVIVAAAGRDTIVTGGDDGRVVATRADGSWDLIGETGGSWVDSLALGPAGEIAYGFGRNVVSRNSKGIERRFQTASTARGLAFAPKGYRLAISHYNGATLWFPDLEATPETLEWKGSHLDIVWSIDGRFVVTSMQENALHGWRLKPTKGHMRMTGYSAKPRSLSWSGDGKWLATSGAEAAVLWPFDSKEGPIGKAPRECGVRQARVSSTAFHPRTPVLALGYEDGCILLVRLSDASELLVRPAIPGSDISCLTWDEAGDRLAFGCKDGQAGILNLPK